MQSAKYRLTNTTEIMNKMPNVLNWLADNKMNVNSSRFSRYKKYIDDFFIQDVDINNEEEALKILEKRFIKLDAAFQECCEIVEIYDAFVSETSKGFKNRLAKVVQGSDFINDRSSNDASRDFQYELIVAARFKEWGYVINFDEETDVIATRGNDIVYVECKKIKSPSALERNYKKAGKQLESQKIKSAYGVVFIDIYDCISNEVKTCEYHSIEDLFLTMNAVISSFVKNNESQLIRINDRFVENALGVCLTANKMLWLSSFSPQYFKKHQMLASEQLSNESFDKFKEIFKQD